ncbi:MAG: GTP-binding protein [Rhodospirillales bacterium]|nr:GTP-binding protein [Rhodospirillales bacterium]
MSAAAEPVPVSVVTGFLGSGKTTLIGRVLRDPAFARSAVIVNEWGEIGIDHTLLAQGSETLMTLATGCLCCRMEGSLGATLRNLAREAGAGGYDRVLVETSGLADPVPILGSVAGDPDLARVHRLDSLITLVDASAGAAALARHPEARRQVAVADRIVLTKTDLAAPDAALDAVLAETAPGVPVLRAVRGAIDPALLFAPADPAARAARLLAQAPAGAADPFARAMHGAGRGGIAIQRDAPIAGAALSLFVETLIAQCGPRLLRLKGLAELIEAPGQPLLLQAIQHALAPIEILPEYPPGFAGGLCLMLIGEAIPPYFPARLLAAIEAEVAEADAALPASGDPVQRA